MVTLEGRCEAISLILVASRDSPNLSYQKEDARAAPEKKGEPENSPVWWMYMPEYESCPIFGYG